MKPTLVLHVLFSLGGFYAIGNGTVSVPTQGSFVSAFEQILAQKWFVALSSVYLSICYGLVLFYEKTATSAPQKGTANTFDGTCLMCCSTSRNGSIHCKRRMRWLICFQSLLYLMWSFFLFHENDLLTATFCIHVLIVNMFCTWYHISKVYFDRCDFHIALLVSIVLFLIDYMYTIYL